MKISVSKQNQKEINALMLNHDGKISVGNLTTGDKTVVENIAWQCPYKGGKAVYDARGIVWKYNPGAKFEDELLCNNGAYFRQSENHSIASRGTEISLFPNPAKNTVTLHYNLSDFKNVTASVADLTGRVLYTFDVDAKVAETNFNVADFANGYYLVKIMAGNNEIKTMKMAIAK